MAAPPTTILLLLRLDLWFLPRKHELQNCRRQKAVIFPVFELRMEFQNVQGGRAHGPASASLIYQPPTSGLSNFG